MTLSIRQIEAFRAVMTAGTTTAAANLMSITQPAVSRLIKDLEESVDFALFVKERGRLVPTARARNFYENVERYFMGLNELEKIAEDIKESQRFSLRVSAMPSLSLELLPLACKNIDTVAKNLEFQFSSCNSYEIPRHLQLGLCHIGIALEYPSIEGIIQETLVEVPYYCAMHIDHRLSSKSVITLKDIRDEEVLNFFQDQSDEFAKTDELMKDLDISKRAKNTYFVELANLGYGLIAQNLAIGFMSPFGAKLWKPHGVVLRKLEHTPIFKYTISYPEKHAESELIQEFADAVKSAANEIVHAVDESAEKS